MFEPIGGDEALILKKYAVRRTLDLCIVEYFAEVMETKCPKCSGTVFEHHQAWTCASCGYAPPHAAD